MKNLIIFKDDELVEDILLDLVTANLIDLILTIIFLILIVILHIKFHHSWKIDLVLLCIAGELALYGGAMFFSSEKYLWTIKILIHITFLTLFLYLFTKMFSVHFIIFFFLLLGLNISFEIFNRAFLNDCIVERRILFTSHKERKKIMYQQVQKSNDIGNNEDAKKSKNNDK